MKPRPSTSTTKNPPLRCLRSLLFILYLLSAPPRLRVPINLVCLYLCVPSFAQDNNAPTWTTTRILPAPEAHQAAAATNQFIFAIASKTIAKYDRATGDRIFTSIGDAQHLNSGFLHAGKLYCAEMGTFVAFEAIHILAGNGYMEEYVVERLARDAKLIELGGGTTEMQILTIAREILRD